MDTKAMTRHQGVHISREECLKVAAGQSQEAFAYIIAYQAWADEAVCKSLDQDDERFKYFSTKALDLYCEKIKGWCL